MPRRPLSDLRTKTKEIASAEQARLDLHRLLDESEADLARGDRGVTLAAVRRQLKPPGAGRGPRRE
jgi:hypothetical protein